MATLGHFFPRKGFLLIALAFFLSPECENSPKTETLQVTHLIELGKCYTWMIPNATLEWKYHLLQKEPWPFLNDLFQDGSTVPSCNVTNDQKSLTAENETWTIRLKYDLQLSNIKDYCTPWWVPNVTSLTINHIVNTTQVSYSFQFSHCPYLHKKLALELVILD